MTKQQVIDRIRKMRKLGAGTGNEAESARAHAERLIKKHGITEEELKAEEVKEKQYRGKIWELWLAKGIAFLRSVGTNECRVMVSSISVEFVDGEAMMAAEDFKWFKPRVEIALGKQTTIADTTEFSKGVVAGVLRRCRAALGVRLSPDVLKDDGNVATKESPAVLRINIPQVFGKLGEEGARKAQADMVKVSAFAQGLQVGRLVDLPPWIKRDPLDDIFDELFGTFED